MLERNSLIKAGIPEALAERMASIKVSQKDAQVIGEFISLSGTDQGKIWLSFFENIDRSRFPSHDWLESLTVLLNHIKAKGLISSPKIVTGYLLCAAQGPEAESGSLTLKYLVEAYLKSDGFANMDF